jgi:hypothetical protein
VADNTSMTRLGNRASKFGSMLATPQDDEAEALREKQANIDEYRRATQPQPPAEDVPPVRQPMMPVDRINPKAQYGSRPGEQRLDVGSMLQPLGGSAPSPQVHIHMSPAAKVPMYDGDMDENNPVVQGSNIGPSMAEDVAAQQAQNPVAGVSPNLSNKEKISGFFTGATGDPNKKREDMSSVGDPTTMQGQVAQPRMYDVQGLSSPRMFDEGGPVKNDPNDGHHQLAIVEEGERVLTPKQNQQYEQEHGAPADFGGRVMQQPNPPVKPMLDTERDYAKPVGGAKMDVSNPPEVELRPTLLRMYDEGGPIEKGTSDTMRPPTEDELLLQEAHAPRSLEERAISGEGMTEAENPVSSEIGFKPIVGHPVPMAKVQPPMMAAPEPAPNVPQQATAQPPAPSVGGRMTPQAPDTSALPTQQNRPAPLAPAVAGPSDHNKFQEAKSELKQKMMDAATGKFNNGKFDQLAYGEAKMALADLELANPLGSEFNHPGIGGKILHGLSVAGQAVGQAFSPVPMSAIPGTRDYINRQSAQGQEEVTKALGSQATEAETGLKQAQTTVAGLPKDLNEGIARETARVQRSAPGTPEHETAQKNLNAYLESDRLQKANKPNLLPQQIADKTAEVMGLPEGSPERAKAEKDLRYLEAQAQASKKETDKRAGINAWGAANIPNYTPTDPKMYSRAEQGYTGMVSGARAEGRFPVWEKQAAIQDRYATQRALLIQGQADANAFGLHKATEQTKADTELGDKIAPLMQIKNLLKIADESTVVSNIIPWLTTMGILKEGHLTRMTQPELNQLSPKQGSLYTWAKANIDKLTAGELPDNYKSEVGNIVDGLIQEANDVHTTKTVAIDKNFGEHAQQMKVTPKKGGGTTVTPEKAVPSGPANAPMGKFRNFADFKNKRQQQ